MVQGPPLPPHQLCSRRGAWGSWLPKRISHSPLHGGGDPSLSIVPGEPQLSLPVALGARIMSLALLGPSLPVWPVRGDWVVGARWEVSLVSLKLIRCLGRVSWRGSGVWRSAEGLASPSLWLHYPAGPSAPEQCQREGAGWTRRWRSV